CHPRLGSAEKVRLQLDGGEAGGSFGQVEDAAVTAGGIGESDDSARVEEAVRRHVFVVEREPCPDQTVPRLLELDSEHPAETGPAHAMPPVGCEPRGPDPGGRAVAPGALPYTCAAMAKK